MITTFDPWLVALSYAAAVIASFIAISFATRVSAQTGRRSGRVWLVGGGAALGIGIWSMHFIGMLALKLPVAVPYDLRTTLFSLLIAVTTSCFALYTSSTGALGGVRLWLSSLLMGLGIAAMHYIGMAAMMVSPEPTYDPLLLALSVVFAVAASMVALRIASGLRGETFLSAFWLKTGSAFVMALAIAGAHYTGMAAAYFSPETVAVGDTRTVDDNWLALAIGLFALLLFLATMLVALLDLRLTESRRQNRELDRRVQERTASLEAANAALVHEIAQRNKVEEKLATSMESLKLINRELEQFAYVASHDLQAPLRTIMGFCELLQRRYQDKLDAGATDFIQQIQQNANHMQTLISGLLAFSRVGGQTMKLEPVACEALLAQALKNLDSVIRERRAEVTHGPLPQVMGSPRELTQLLQNLIGNGLKFQPGAHPKVHVSAERDGDLWRLSVADRGIGIAGEDQRDIFNIFHRVHPDGPYEGSGIGLAICQKIVKRHGGDLWVESKPGEGSTFHFTLKAADIAAAEAQPPFAERRGRERRLAGNPSAGG